MKHRNKHGRTTHLKKQSVAGESFAFEGESVPATCRVNGADVRIKDATFDDLFGHAEETDSLRLWKLASRMLAAANGDRTKRIVDLCTPIQDTEQ
jgi:hypothetical protein